MARRKMNSIKALQLDNGDWVTKVVQIRRFVQHFKSVYNETLSYIHFSNVFPPQFINSLSKLSQVEYFILQQMPTQDEITRAVFILGPDKARGPDGLNARLI
jgi:hypothetical protein